jgi:RNA polymerase sigma factor (sigma-70 family)
MTHFSGIHVAPQVLHAARDGDLRAHEAIYKACQRPVYSLIRRLIPRAAVADELFQETFVEILRSIHGYTGDGAFGGWVRAIAVNKCLMYLRSPWHRNLLRLAGEDEQPGPIVTLATRADAQIEAQADLQRALESLPPLTRSIVWLHDVEGYTHVEIARLLGRTTSFSKSQLARAHQRLRQLLEPQSEPLSCTQISTTC